MGLVKFLAVGCGLNDCSLSRTWSMISLKSSRAPKHSPSQIAIQTRALPKGDAQRRKKGKRAKGKRVTSSKPQKRQRFDHLPVARPSEAVRNFLLHPLDRPDPPRGHKRRAHVERYLLRTIRGPLTSKPKLVIQCKRHTTAIRTQLVRILHLHYKTKCFP